MSQTRVSEHIWLSWNVDSNLSEIAWVKFVSAYYCCCRCFRCCSPPTFRVHVFVSFGAILWMNYLLCKMKQYFLIFVFLICIDRERESDTQSQLLMNVLLIHWVCMNSLKKRNGWLLLVSWIQLTIIRRHFLLLLTLFFSPFVN